MEEPDGDGEGRNRYLELRKGGIDMFDDISEDTVESVGDRIEDVSECWYLSLFWLKSQLGERGIDTAFNFECIDNRALLRRYSLLGLT